MIETGKPRILTHFWVLSTSTRNNARIHLNPNDLENMNKAIIVAYILIIGLFFANIMQLLGAISLLQATDLRKSLYQSFLLATRHQNIQIVTLIFEGFLLFVFCFVHRLYRWEHGLFGVTSSLTAISIVRIIFLVIVSKFTSTMYQGAFLLQSVVSVHGSAPRREAIPWYEF